MRRRRRGGWRLKCKGREGKEGRRSRRGGGGKKKSWREERGEEEPVKTRRAAHSCWPWAGWESRNWAGDWRSPAQLQVAGFPLVCSTALVSGQTHVLTCPRAATAPLEALINCQVCFEVVPPKYTRWDQTGTEGINPYLPVAIATGGSEWRH